MSLADVKRESEEKVRAQFEPLFLDFYRGSKMYKAYFETLADQLERTNRATNFLQILLNAFDKIKEAKMRTVVMATTYLALIELIGSGYVDMAILLLVAKGHDLHLEPDYTHRYTRHVKSLEDLDSPSLPLSTKLDFLSTNGLSFFEDWVDRYLRNKIAHMDFEIDNDGKFYVFSEKGRKEVDIGRKISSFDEYWEAVTNVLQEQKKRVTAPGAFDKGIKKRVDTP